MAANFAPNRYESLNALLTNVLTENSAESAKQLQDQLPSSEELLSLTDDIPKNASHRSTLQKGSYTVNNEVRKADTAFQEEALLLADFLNLDEFLSAAWIEYANEQKARFDRPATTVAVILYHTEELNKFYCLNLLLRIAYIEDTMDPQLRNVARNAIESFFSGNSQLVKNAFTIKALDFIKNANKTIEDAKNWAGKISDEAIGVHQEKIQEKRRVLGLSLFAFSFTKRWMPEEINRLMEHLIDAPLSDRLTRYIVLALLNALESSTSYKFQDEKDYALLNDEKFLDIFNRNLLSREWSVGAMKALITVQWGLFLLCAIERSPNIAISLSFREEQIGKMVRDAFEVHPIEFARQYVIGFQLDTLEFAGWEGVEPSVLKESCDGITDEFFVELIFNAMDNFVTNFITRMADQLRKLKLREEEVYWRRMQNGYGASSMTLVRKDVELFFDLIAALYRKRSNAGLRFWVDPRLHGFLEWASGSRSAGLVRSCLEMLASLATGSESSSYAADFIHQAGAKQPTGAFTEQTNLCSWQHLFYSLNMYAASFRSTAASGEPSGYSIRMRPEEAITLAAFLKLVRQVVQYSPMARITLYENPQYRAIPVMFELLSAGLDPELKAAFFETIAAFCIPGGGVGSGIARNVWSMLEQYQVLEMPKQLPNSEIGKLSQAYKGILFELEQVEGPMETFPATRAFVKLLYSLIHYPIKTSYYDSSIVKYGIRSPSIPENLGSPYREPGIYPYIRFVVDHVFLKASSRNYVDKHERWRMQESSLRVIEKSLLTFNLGIFRNMDIKSVLDLQNRSSLKPEEGVNSLEKTIASLSKHPGYDLTIQILSGMGLLIEMLNILREGADTVDKNSHSADAFTACIKLCLRILNHVMTIQDIFINLVMHLILEYRRKTSKGDLYMVPSVVRLDQLLLYHQETVVQIALYVKCHSDPEVALRSVQLIHSLSTSFSFGNSVDNLGVNVLAGLLSSSTEWRRIQFGYIDKLELSVTESDDDYTFEDEIQSEDLLRDFGSPKNVTSMLRHSILEMLLENVSFASKAVPNIAHLLLGFQIDGTLSNISTETKDPSSRISCLDTVFSLIQSKNDDSSQFNLPLNELRVREACFNLLYILASNQYTANITIRYLSRRNYFTDQIQSLKKSIHEYRSWMMLQKGDDDRSASYLFFSMMQYGWLLKSIALDLHYAATNENYRLLSEYLTVLFGFSNSNNAFEEGPIFSLLEGTDFGKQANDEVFLSEDSIFRGLKFTDAVYFRSNKRQCHIYDILAIYERLQREILEFEQKNAHSGSTREQFREETRLILLKYVKENRLRSLYQGKQQFLEGWKDTVGITIVECKNQIPLNLRKEVYGKIVLSLLSNLNKSENSVPVLELLSELVVICMSEASSDQSLRMLSKYPFSNGEVSQMIFKELITAIILMEGSSSARGNLYVAVLHYFRLASLSESENIDKTKPFDGSVSGGATRRGTIESYVLSSLRTFGERLLEAVCNDCLHSPTVWRALAFTVLSFLVHLWRQERSNYLLQYISRWNVLRQFISDLKRGENVLKEALSSRTEPPTILYVYEAKMAFLLRLAESRDGAQKLLEFNLLEALSESHVFDKVVEASQILSEQNEIAKERSSKVLILIMKVIANVLCNAGSENSFAGSRVTTRFLILGL